MFRFGAPDSLGDIDALAWNLSLKLVLVMECKRLQKALTVGEIVEQLRRFKGKAEDELGIHMRRFRWLQENSQTLEKTVGFPRIRFCRQCLQNLHPSR